MHKLMVIAVVVGGIFGLTLTAAATDSGSAVVNVVTQHQQQTVVFPSPTPGPAYALFITDDRSVVRPGESLTYRVVVRNSRDHDLNEATLTVRVPEFVVPSATQPGAADVNPATRRIRWTEQTISAGAEVTYSIQATVQGDAPDDFVLHAVADVSAPGARLNAEDATTVERLTAVSPEAAVSTAPPAAATVGVTAKTGSASTALWMALAGAAGALGLALHPRKTL